MTDPDTFAKVISEQMITITGGIRGRMDSSREPLTRRQEEILRFIHWHTEQLGYPPTLREIAKKMGIRGISAVHKHIDALVRKGHLLRRKGARALDMESVLPPMIPVPVLGRVAAGIPILSEENRLDTVSIDPSWIPSGPIFLLRVKGDSMKQAAILDGDYVLVRAKDTAENEEIVVAEIDGETTVKRLRRKNGDIILVPENPDYDEIPISENRAFRIVGTVAGVFRPSVGGPH